MTEPEVIKKPDFDIFINYQAVAPWTTLADDSEEFRHNEPVTFDPSISLLSSTHKVSHWKLDL